MPNSRNQRIDDYFNSPEWTLANDIRLMNFLRVATAPYPTLSSMLIFNEVINQVHFDVKTRVRALQSRFNDFKEYITEPGVHFNPNNLTVTIDPAQYVAQHAGDSYRTYKVILFINYACVLKILLNAAAINIF